MKILNNHKERNKKILCIFLSIYMAIVSNYFLPKQKKEIEYNPDYVVGKLVPYAKYNGKNIYIAPDELIDEADLDKDGIYIGQCFKNNKNDFNMSIHDSYKIIYSDDQNAILTILIHYDKEYPSEWNRTLESMKNEWDIHNICYYLGYETERTGTVDLNNFDEEMYNNNKLMIILDNKPKN